jgi:hypothetical protein
MNSVYLAPDQIPFMLALELQFLSVVADKTQLTTILFVMS